MFYDDDDVDVFDCDGYDGLVNVILLFWPFSFSSGSFLFSVFLLKNMEIESDKFYRVCS